MCQQREDSTCASSTEHATGWSEPWAPAGLWSCRRREVRPVPPGSSPREPARQSHLETEGANEGKRSRGRMRAARKTSREGDAVGRATGDGGTMDASLGR